jgi:hypothetical protein
MSMTRETKDQRELRRAAEAHSALIAAEAFRAGLPKRMLEIQANAVDADMGTEVRLTQTGPSLRIWENGEGFFEETITYETEEWEVEHTERHIRDLKEAKDGRIRRRGIAEDVWANKLLDEEKSALKENIHFLR